jgi:hypothetical protein
MTIDATDTVALAVWLALVGILGFTWAVQEMEHRISKRVDVVALASIAFIVAGIVTGMYAHDMMLKRASDCCWQPKEYVSPFHYEEG